MGFMLASIQSRVMIPLFVLLLPSGRSPSLFIALPFSPLVLRIPFDSPFSPHPHPSAAPSSIYREEVSHTTDSRQFSHLESQNFSLRYPSFSLFLPSSVLPLCAFSRSLSFSLSFSSFLQRLSYSWIYLYISSIYIYTRVYSRAFRFYSFRRYSVHTHLPSSFSSSSRSLPPFCPLSFCESTFERSISLLPPYLFLPGSRHTRFSSFFLPRSVSPPVPSGCTLSHPLASPPSPLALLYRAIPPSLTSAHAAATSGSFLALLSCSFAHGF